MKIRLNDHYIFNTDLYSSIYRFGETVLIFRTGDREDSVNFASQQERDKAFNVISSEAANMDDFDANGNRIGRKMKKAVLAELQRLGVITEEPDICPNSKS